MYPQQFFSLFPPFPRTTRAFVAMSFHSAFDARWSSVIKPGLTHILSNNAPLDPFRVDLSRASDAILVEVLQAIADSLVIFADITALHELDGRPVRNANVMYEIGLAHAARLPEEVILFRSDNYKLDFDIAGVRVHSYDPDSNPDVARALVTDTVLDSVKGLEARRRASVRAAVQRLTLPAFELLLRSFQTGVVSHPPTKTFGQALGSIQSSQAIALLLDLGAIRADFLRVTADLLEKPAQDPMDPPLLSYKTTSFGEAMMKHAGEELGLTDPALKERFEARGIKTDVPSAS